MHISFYGTVHFDPVFYGSWYGSWRTCTYFTGPDGVSGLWDRSSPWLSSGSVCSICDCFSVDLRIDGYDGQQYDLHCVSTDPNGENDTNCIDGSTVFRQEA